MRTILATALVLAAATPALAEDNELTIGSSVRALRSDSANAVTGEGLGGPTLAYGRAVWRGLIPNLAVWATGGLQWGSSEGTLFQTMDTEIDLFGITGGGRAVYTVHPRIAVSARLDLGAARTGLTLARGDRRVSDDGWGATAGAALGLDLRVIERHPVALGLRVELGYVAHTDVELAPRAATDETRIELDTMQASIGHLDLGGPYATFSLLGQF